MLYWFMQRTLNMSFKKRLVFYSIFVHLLLLVCLVPNGIKTSIAARLGLFPTEINPFWQTMLNLHQRRLAQLPEGTLVIIGDSHVQGLWQQSLATQVLGLGVAGDTSFGVLKRVQQYRHLEKSRAIILAVGLNDIKRRSVEDILVNYEQILQSLPKTVPLFMVAVMPVDESVLKVEWNARIQRLNRGLQRLAAACQSCTYVPVARALLSEQGLKASVHEGDGIHLNAAGYTIWVSQLREFLPKNKT